MHTQNATVTWEEVGAMEAFSQLQVVSLQLSSLQLQPSGVRCGTAKMGGFLSASNAGSWVQRRGPKAEERRARDTGANLQNTRFKNEGDHDAMSKASIVRLNRAFFGKIVEGLGFQPSHESWELDSRSSLGVWGCRVCDEMRHHLTSSRSSKVMSR